MTVDAVVNIFQRSDIKTQSPSVAFQTEAESQRDIHRSPGASLDPLPLGPTPKPAPTALAELASFNSKNVLIESAQPDLLRGHVNLDAFSPPPPAAAVLPPFAHADCAFCGTVGTPHTCGALVEVSDEYLNLEAEWRTSQRRRCGICGDFGAAVRCTHAGCRACYHLPCAALATDIVLNKASFELWCPKHAVLDSDEEESRGGVTGRYTSASYRNRTSAAAYDEDFAPETSSRPRRYAALSRKHRFQRSPSSFSNKDRAASAAAAVAAAMTVSDRAQRPRTDWQRQGNVWIKVVPPWWCEHRTIHFANKVFRELFCGASSAILVDTDGGEWDSIVFCETRNDMRLQYTLQGQFHDYWDAAGVKAGDVLTFERDIQLGGKILVGRFHQGRGLDKALQDAGAGGSSIAAAAVAAAAVEIGAAAALQPPPGCRATGARSSGTALAQLSSSSGKKHAVQQFVDDPTSSKNLAVPPSTSYPRQQQRQSHGQGSGHPNRWTDLPDGSASKTVYKSTLMHQQCPIAGWLYRKLYDRVPNETDIAPMYDPILGSDCLFEVAYVPAANVHYISGRTFGAWMKHAGLKSGDQIRVWRDHAGVKVCRMASGQQTAAIPTSSPAMAGGSGVCTGQRGPSAVAALFVNPITNTRLPSQHQENDIARGHFTGFPAAATPMAVQTMPPLSPPSTGDLAPLNALAAAAGYAGQHGTPAIQAVLLHASELRDQGEDALREALVQRLAGAGIPLPPSPFIRKRKAPPSSEDEIIDIIGPATTKNVAALRASNAEDGGRLPVAGLPMASALAPSSAAQGPRPGLLPINHTTARSVSTLPATNSGAAAGGIGAPAGSNGATLAPGQQVQLQQALQQLMRQYQTNQPAEGVNSSSGVPNTAARPAAGRPVPAAHSPQNPGVNSRPPVPPTFPPTRRVPPTNAPAPTSGLGSGICSAVTTALGRHQWDLGEAALLVQFRTRCALLDTVGREVAFMNVLQLQHNKEALLEFIRGIVASARGNGVPGEGDVAPPQQKEGVTSGAAAEDDPMDI